MKIPTLIVTTLFLFAISKSFCQCLENKITLARVDNIKNSSTLTDKEKLEQFYAIKQIIENCRETNDSVYVAVLIDLGDFENYLNNNNKSAIDYTASALKINNDLKTKGSKYLTRLACYNLGRYYQAEQLYKKALIYYDSTMFFCKEIDESDFLKKSTRYSRIYIYLTIRDYQKAIEETTIGISTSLKSKDTNNYIYFLNRKAWALYNYNNTADAFKSAQQVIPFAKKLNDFYELNTAYKTTALCYANLQKFDSAYYFFNKAMALSSSNKDFSALSSDFIDLGNFYLFTLHQYNKAIECFNLTLKYALLVKDEKLKQSKKALVFNNLGATCMYKNQLQEAEKFLLLSFSNLNINLNKNILSIPTSLQLDLIENKDLSIELMINKTKLHLQQYKKQKKQQFLDACLRSALLTDSSITQLRHEQLGEQSKIYWRTKLSEFFKTAIEASYLGNRNDYAFYFMEKSRAVLLNDKLNELNASSYLSSSDASIQEDLKVKIIELRQKLSSLSEASTQYQAVQTALLNSQTESETFIKSLEKRYPAYYQYKYADSVPLLKQLQQYLAKNNQSFVHYFFGDTVTYILGITATNTKLIRLSQKEFNKQQLDGFLQFCANKEALNKNHPAFTMLSYSIYKSIFQGLQLPKGRIVICMDNIVIPFEALCSDDKGNHFLLNDYSFAYTYSARFLMKQFNNPAAKGNFAGFAPVSFDSSLKVVELKDGATALNASAAHYKNEQLFTHQNASRRNFFTYTPSYSIVNIFSHAFADTTDNEPVLFMQDSLIHLSELQRLNNPATKLVLLSACQTNVGKNATGEGIYSLARGFAIAGIPAVAATLWKADEETIYAISEKFNEYLSEGMNKDEALQKAKLNFIQANSDNQKLLPYYWANMIVIGNTDAIKFDASSGYSIYIWLIIAIAVLIIAMYVIRQIRLSPHKS